MENAEETKPKARKFDRQGLKEAKPAIEKLQQLWPAVFPAKAHLVRPLASSAIPGIMEKTAWSLAYTRAVLSVWKQRDAYCNAVLHYEFRIDLDGAKTDHLISENAREQARQTLARNRVSRAKRQAAALERAAASPQPGQADEPKGGTVTNKAA